jgi:Rab-GTPase-TBC domain
MNFLAGVLLMYLPSEADAYGALVVLMQHRHMRELYKEDLAWLQASCQGLNPHKRFTRRVSTDGCPEGPQDGCQPGTPPVACMATAAVRAQWV